MNDPNNPMGPNCGFQTHHWVPKTVSVKPHDPCSINNPLGGASTPNGGDSFVLGEGPRARRLQKFSTFFSS